MPLKTITLSSASTTSAAANLDWRAGARTTASVSINSTQATGSIQPQYTLQDIMLTPSTGITWLPLSSAATDVSSATFADRGVGFDIDEPIAALRLFSSTVLSSGTVTFNVMQADRS